MQIRLHHHLIVSVTAFLGFLFAASAIAQEEPFIEGGHYELLSEVQPVQTGEKIEVAELFWYRCPHCYRLEPYMLAWVKTKPENAEFVLIPAVLNKQWAFHARVYYTFETLGLVEQLHAALFTALHAEGKKLNSIEKIADWAAEKGADRQSIIDAFSSFAIENKLNFAQVMSRKYGISGVPSIIVDGRYRTSVSLAGSHEKLIEVINFLVAKAAEVRGNS